MLCAALRGRRPSAHGDIYVYGARENFSPNRAIGIIDAVCNSYVTNWILYLSHVDLFDFQYLEFVSSFNFISTTFRVLIEM